MKTRLLIICIVSNIYAACPTDFPLHGKRFMLTRSQSVNAARDLADWHRNFPFACDTKNWWTSFSVATEYIHSFRSDQIAEYFFGTPYIQVSGSQVPSRGYYDILADYFGLGQTFSSSLYLRPMLENTLADFRYHIGYDHYYLHIHAPLVWARTHIIIDECINNNGLAAPFEPLYMDTSTVEPVVSSFCQAISQGATYGQVTESLHFGRFGCPQSTTKLSEIQVALGWIFAQRPNGWVSANIRGSIPTGTRPNSHFLFEPIVGNGHHGELGLGFYSQGLLWQKDDDKFISLFVEANFTHLFGDTQCRSFDLCSICDDCFTPIPPANGFGSSYILAKEFDSAGNYRQQVTPLINYTTLPVNVSIDIQMDLALMFAFDFGKWTVDIGYDAWFRSRERITLLNCLPQDTIALKGIQNVALLMGGPSNVTQSKATLHGNYFTEQTAVADANSPVFVTTAQLDLSSGASSRMLTHKIFMYGQHIWQRFTCRLQSFTGLGFEVEFEGNRPKNLQPNKLAVSQWGIWLKAGIGY